MARSLEPPFGIVGLGLVGGSLAWALRRAFGRGEIVGVEPDAATRAAALQSDAVDRAAASCAEAAGLSACSLVLVCTPLRAIPAVFAELAALAPRGVITDVAGVKEQVERWALELLPRATFVGGHPMAGGEGGGFAQARADVFEGAAVAVCAPPGADPEAVAAVTALWQRLGGRPRLMSAQEHDTAAAWSSHLPYLNALALLDRLAAGADHLHGRGFTDATRHAGFDPEIMATVAASNPELPAAVRAFAQELEQLARACEGDLEALLEVARRARERRRQILGS